MSHEESENNNNHLDATYNRIKANGFFLLGSILYLPPRTADVLVPSGENEDKLWYISILVAGMLSYLANGIFEMIIAHRGYKQQQADIAIQQEQQNETLEGTKLTDGSDAPVVVHSYPYRGDIANGGLFAVGALFEILSAGFWKQSLMTLSGIFYLFNAFGVLWLRRLEARDADSPLTSADYLVQIGDFLFLVGSIFDLSTTIRAGGKQPLDENTAQWIAELKLTSAFLWFMDGVLYLVADKILLDTTSNSEHDRLRHEPSEKTVEIPENKASHTLSPLV